MGRRRKNILISTDIGARGESAYVVAPFDKGKQALEKRGYRVISLQEGARLRVQEGVNADVSKDHFWVREAAIYVPDKGAYLTKNSPILANAEEATKFSGHPYNCGLYLSPEQTEQSLEGAIELVRGADHRFEHLIPTDRFGENELMVYVFGKDAQTYGQFLKDAGINEMSLSTYDHTHPSTAKPNAKPVSFGGVNPVEKSQIVCFLHHLHHHEIVRGIR